MPTIIVRSQADWNALPKSFAEFTTVQIQCGESWVTIEAIPGSSHVEARGSSHVEAWESSHVEARGSSHVVARGSSHVEAWESSHVVAWGSSHVVARGSSHVEAWESSHVVAWGSSHVEAWESSHVVAWGSSHVEAWESSHVEAWESSHVEARGSSHVVARGSSHVEAWGQSSLHQRSLDKKSELHGQAVCFLYDGAGVPIRKSDGVTVIQVQNPKGVTGWLEQEGVVETDGSVVLYKRVSKDFRTQEGRAWETTWVVGEVVRHPSWNPSQECGGGQFHACSRPYFCDEFRSTAGDVYVAIQVKFSDLHVHEFRQYQHKVSLRECVVLFECDRYGKQTPINSEVAA